MYKNIFVFAILVGLFAFLAYLMMSFTGNESLNSLSEHYASQGLEEVGAANLVTSVVVTYRGLDTLGEVSILFLTAAIIAFFLKVDGSERSRKVRRASELLQTASKVLVPVVILFGAYVFINGHLTPGGGFQGGAIVASGLVLLVLARPERKVSKKLIHTVESISGLTFVLIGILGIVLAGGFLDNRIMSLGTFGTLLSAGAIPIIYIFVGLKVGSELSNIILSMQESQKD